MKSARPLKFISRLRPLSIVDYEHDAGAIAAARIRGGAGASGVARSATASSAGEAAMIDAIATLWAQEPQLPLSAIADELGLTRGSIAGRIARGRRKGDHRFPARGPRKRIPKPAAARPRQKPKAVAAAASLMFGSASEPPGRPTPRAVGPPPLTSLRADQCRWPINAPEPHDVFLFCAAPTTGGNYCAKHAALARSSASASSPRAPSPAGRAP